VHLKITWLIPIISLGPVNQDRKYILPGLMEPQDYYFVELNKSNIWAKSKIREGSTFYFTFLKYNEEESLNNIVDFNLLNQK